MSYIEQAKQNAANAQKAAQLDQMQNMQRDQNNYNQGAMDLQRRLQQEVQDRLAQEAASRQYDAAMGTPTPTVTFSEFVKPATEGLSNWWNDLKNRVSNYDFIQNESTSKQQQDSRGMK